MTSCPICRRPVDGRTDRCRDGVDERLRQIPGLYRLLADVLEPGTAPAERVSGSRTAPLPVRLEPLTLRGRGGIVTLLATWETYWRDLRGLPPVKARAGVEQLLAGDAVVDAVVAFLRAHLDWAFEHDPQVAGFAETARGVVQSCHSALGFRNGAMLIGQCPTVDDSGTTCGQRLYADPYLDTIRCHRCHADWPRARWLILGATIAGKPAT